MKAICDKYNLPHSMPKEVEIADRVLLVTEKRDLMGMPPKAWEDNSTEPLTTKICAQTPNEAEFAFLHRFNEITKGFSE